MHSLKGFITVRDAKNQECLIKVTAIDIVTSGKGTAWNLTEIKSGAQSVTTPMPYDEVMKLIEQAQSPS